MGATAIGSMEYTIARSYLKKQGVDLAKIEWVATRQTSNTIQAHVGRPDRRGLDRDVVGRHRAARCIRS